MRTKFNPMPSTTLIILLFWLPSIIIRSSSAFRQDAGIITRKSTIKNISKASRLFATQQHHPSMNHPRMTRLVLVGGGHAHVQVIKSLNAQARPPNLHVTLVDMQSNASYSGMVPGCVAKLYTLDQVQIALNSLAEWADIEFVCGKVVGMSLDEEGANKDDIFEKLLLVEVDDENDGKVRKDIPFDVISLDIGSTTRDFSSIPGASQYTISTRPISELVQRIEREEEALKETLAGTNDTATYRPTRVVVVGGGAAGIELSLAMRARWDALIKKNIPATADSSSQLSITLLDSNDQLLPSENLACRTALENLMDKYNVNIRHNAIVHEVTSSHIHVGPNNRKTSANVIDESTSSKIPYTHCIWATGAESHKLSWDLHRQCGLSISKYRGWIQVNQYLQSVSHPYIFAAGDCCEILNGNKKSPPKAGVYAVRSGPILIENLTRLLGENANNLVPYEPQDDFLKLIMAGDGTALGFRFGIPLYGKWVWQLKDHIDRMFMDLFDVRHLPKCKASSSDVVDDQVVEAGNSAADMSTCRPKSYETSQYDAIIERPPPMNAVDAAKLLVRTDDDVEFHLAWNVLRDMMADENYMSEVLNDISGI